MDGSGRVLGAASRSLPVVAVVMLALCVGGEMQAGGGLKASRFDDGRTVVAGDHFRLTVDSRRGGEITDIQLFDGSQWNRVLGADGQTCPAFNLSDAAGEYGLSNAADAQVGRLEQTPDVIRFESTGALKTADGRGAPWTAKLRYEIHAEGAVFVDLDCALQAGEVALTGASLGLTVDRALTKRPHFNTANPMTPFPGFESGRVAFGVNPAKSYTNEIEVIVERQDSMTAQPQYTMKAVKNGRSYGVPVGCADRSDKPQGRFAWAIVTQPSVIHGPYRYTNRMAIGLGIAATRKPRTNIIGQRVYTWLNSLSSSSQFNGLNTDGWYPTDEQIDKMAANRATILVLHKWWMREPGLNGKPHGDYVPRDEKELIRAVERAHARGLRVGFYCRGIEPFGLGFFAKYARRNWDGLFVDWHGSRCLAVHDRLHEPQAGVPEKHYSQYGTRVPARDYFLTTKRMRDVVGANGFLLGHMWFNSGALANLTFDAFIPGEVATDWEMFGAEAHRAVYAGMMGGGGCAPWPVATSARAPEAVAKMAVWGFYPNAFLAYKTHLYKPDVQILAADPDAPSNRWVLPYWRLLAAIDMERAAVYNLPCVNVVAATCSKPEFQCLVYKQDCDTYLVIVANLGKMQEQAEVVLASQILGLRGEYQLSHVDAATGKIALRGVCTSTLTTSELPPWGIEAFKLQRK